MKKELWQGVLTIKPLSFGPVDTVCLDDRVVFSLYFQDDALLALRCAVGKQVKIVLEYEEEDRARPAKKGGRQENSMHEYDGSGRGSFIFLVAAFLGILFLVLWGF